jgi:hypothetical protein
VKCPEKLVMSRGLRPQLLCERHHKSLCKANQARDMFPTPDSMLAVFHVDCDLSWLGLFFFSAPLKDFESALVGGNGFIDSVSCHWVPTNPFC